MDDARQNVAVMFADVVGSTRIYDRLGDAGASQLIIAGLNTVSDIVACFDGIVVKTIGDELMCRFASADIAVACACEIQKQIQSRPPNKGILLNFQIGIHWGVALLQEDGDLLGDAVNMAARMVGIAKSRQIIISGDTFSALSHQEQISKCRELDSLWVKGKTQVIPVIDVMWEPGEATHMMTINIDNQHLLDDAALTIYFNQTPFLIKQGAPVYTIGRDPGCDLVINSSRISRIHARIENRRGRFVLIDESTNGTYLTIRDMQPVFLRREELTLHGRGMIGFGEVPELDKDLTLLFQL